MSSEDDKQLKNLLSQTLESKGILPKLRAELRANVFLALEGNEKFNEKLQTNNSLIKNLFSTQDGLTSFYIIQEFLEFFNLDYTLSVLEPEITASSTSPSQSSTNHINYNGRSKLISDLNLNYIKNNVQLPILIQIMNYIKSNQEININSIPDQETKLVNGEISNVNNKNLMNGVEHSHHVVEEKIRLNDNADVTQDIIKLDVHINENGLKEDTTFTSSNTNQSSSPSPIQPPLDLDLPSINLSNRNVIQTTHPHHGELNKLKSISIKDEKLNKLKTQDVNNIINQKIKEQDKENINQILKAEDKENVINQKILKAEDTGSVSEIEEDLDSVDDLLNSSGSLRDDVTRDNSISTLLTDVGDYIEDVQIQR